MARRALLLFALISLAGCAGETGSEMVWDPIDSQKILKADRFAKAKEWEKLGTIAANELRLDDALKYINAMIQFYPEDQNLYLWRLSFYYQQYCVGTRAAGDVIRAARAIAQPERNAALAMVYMGYIYTREGQPRQAAECFKQSLDKATTARGYDGLSYVCELEGQYDKALEYSTRALREGTNEPPDVIFRLNIAPARIYAKMGRPEMAEKLTAVLDTPDKGDYEKACLRAIEGKHKEAAGLLREFLSAAPSGQARSYYRESFKMDPNLWSLRESQEFGRVFEPLVNIDDILKPKK